jgi:hypothetical protein
MHKTVQTFYLSSCSDNRKSKRGPADQKRPRRRKWVGIFAIALTFIIGGAVARAQQAGKAYRIGYVGNASGVGPAQDAFKNRSSGHRTEDFHCQ